MYTCSLQNRHRNGAGVGGHGGRQSRVQSLRRTMRTTMGCAVPVLSNYTVPSAYRFGRTVRLISSVLITKKEINEEGGR